MSRIFEGNGFSLPLGEKTYVMGILNVTPDSFSDGGLWFDSEKAIAHALQMIEDGADILDIGAQSTRPGHIEIPPEEELKGSLRFYPLSRIKSLFRFPLIHIIRKLRRKFLKWAPQ